MINRTYLHIQYACTHMCGREHTMVTNIASTHRKRYRVITLTDEYSNQTKKQLVNNE